MTFVASEKNKIINNVKNFEFHLDERSSNANFLQHSGVTFLCLVDNYSKCNIKQLNINHKIG